MLKIRLTRCGRSKSPFFRVLLAEKDAPIKGRFIEVLGSYHPISKDKNLDLKTERILYWISKGAQPSPTVASLCKKFGMKDMEQYLENPTKKKVNKKAAKANA